VRDSFVTFVTKTSLFQTILEIFSTFLIFLWIVEHIFIVADVNAHRLVYHTYGVSVSFRDVRDKIVTF
jgi:hypothetical protein